MKFFMTKQVVNIDKNKLILFYILFLRIYFIRCSYYLSISTKYLSNAFFDAKFNLSISLVYVFIENDSYSY